VPNILVVFEGGVILKVINTMHQIIVANGHLKNK
jgi:hypothetical protein